MHVWKWSPLMGDMYSSMSTALPFRDPGDEGLDPELSGEEGRGLRTGEKRPAQ